MNEIVGVGKIIKKNGKIVSSNFDYKFYDYIDQCHYVYHEEVEYYPRKIVKKGRKQIKKDWKEYEWSKNILKQ